jgi:hypothetical protein
MMDEVIKNVRAPAVTKVGLELRCGIATTAAKAGSFLCCEFGTP